jgi:hypothetical protein
MSDEPQFVNGLIFKMPHENAPEFVKGALSIRVEELMTFLTQQKTEWVNIDLKVSKKGKPYAQVNTFVPESRQDEAIRQNNPAEHHSGAVGQKNPTYAKNDDFDQDIPF